MRPLIPLALISVCALASCESTKEMPAKKKTVEPAPPPPPQQPPQRPPEKPPEQPPAPAGAGIGHNQAANCPSAVAGAETTVADAADGVEVTITSKDAAAVTDIRARAAKAVEANKAAAGPIEHTGQGTGGGAMGKCPVLIRDTALSSAEVEGGVKMTVKPTRAEDLKAVQQMAKDRVAAIKAGGPPAEGKAGQNQMANCPSAVAGSSTAVADLPDGVEVTVTAVDPAAVADIRARAKKVAASAMAQSEAISHTGAGTGGGGMGKCPVVLSGAITVAEVDGGAKLTVRPDKPEELKNLQKAAHDRAAAMQQGEPPP